MALDRASLECGIVVLGITRIKSHGNKLIYSNI